MDYFVSCYDCCVLNPFPHKLLAGAKYRLNNVCKQDVLCVSVNHQMLTINCYDLLNNFDTNPNFVVAQCEQDRVLILCKDLNYISNCYMVKANKTEYFIICGNNLKISCWAESVCNASLSGLTLVDSEEFCGYTIFYFTGARKAVAILDKRKLLIADYYDEFNSNATTKIFMKRCKDALNHGFVFKLGESGIKTSLVYLDDGDLNLTKPFVCVAFVDCLKVKNFAYCKNLLAPSLCGEVENLKQFFKSFDKAIFYSEDVVILLEKNTLVGVYKFEVANNKIENIVELNV